MADDKDKHLTDRLLQGYHKMLHRLKTSLQEVGSQAGPAITSHIDLAKDLPFPEIEKNWDIKDISNLLSNYSAILVKEYGEYIGIITDADFLKFT